MSQRPGPTEGGAMEGPRSAPLLADSLPPESLHRRARPRAATDAAPISELERDKSFDWGLDESLREQPERSTRAFTESIHFSSAERSAVFGKRAGGASLHGYQPAYRPPLHRVGMADAAHGPYLRSVPAQIQGLYLVKFAVSTTACYLAIQLLINFAEVLLPFIFSVLCTIILEPLKKFIMRIFQRLAVLLFQRLNWQCCLEVHHSEDQGVDSGYRSEFEGEIAVYGSLAQDSPAEDSALAAAPGGQGASRQPVQVPAPGVKKAILVLSIFFCMVLSGRVLWLTAKVFVRAGYIISGNLESYRQGATRLKAWFRECISEAHMEALDYGKVLDDLVTEVENIGTVVTQNVLYTALQGVVTFIFLIYMLYSPVKMESGAVTREVFVSTSRYLKVKCLISAFTGLSVAILLAVIGLDLPAAFGLLAFIANFLPGIGSFASSVLPCILAMIDVRKTPTQVLLAFVCQLTVHFCIDFVIEPVFFGISVEIHSVIVILGIYFFYQVWGVPGMLLSVPLLAVLRILMKSMKLAAGKAGGEEADTIVFLDNILEGRWMSSVGESAGDEELEMPELSIYQPSSSKEISGEQGDPGIARPPRPGLWASFNESCLGKWLHQAYRTHRLLLDVTLLAAIFYTVLLTPL